MISQLHRALVQQLKLTNSQIYIINAYVNSKLLRVLSCFRSQGKHRKEVVKMLYCLRSLLINTYSSCAPEELRILPMVNYSVPDVLW